MPLDLSIHELHKRLKEKRLTSRELLEEAYGAIERLDPDFRAFITIRDKKETLLEADARDKETPRGPLHGLPFCVKDAYATRGVLTTAGSKVLGTFVPPYDATVVKRLKDAGAVLVGKNNLDAWGHGGSSENTDYGPVRNPWDKTRVAGGSSGGSAAAVALRMSAFAIGEDTGGSIRNPASMCGISGLKVTYGRVSRYGAIAYASSLDSVGPMAKSVSDIAYILEAIAGHDPKDATSSKRPVPRYSTFLSTPLGTLRIGIPKEFLADGVDSEVRRVFEDAVRTFEKMGARIVPVSIPSLSHAVSMYYLIAMSETSSNLARYDGIRFGNTREHFSKETMRRIIVGTFALKTGYHDELYTRAQKGRTLLIREFEAAWNACDVLLGPTLPDLPPGLGELESDPLRMLLADSLTVPVNLAGLPSLSIPAGFSQSGPPRLGEAGLPVGIQLIGKRFDEKTILSLGSAFESATGWHLKRPNF